MRRTLVLLCVSFSLVSFISGSSLEAREFWLKDDVEPTSATLSLASAADAGPVISRHDVGNMKLAVYSNGHWGRTGNPSYDYFTGEPMTVGHEYPKGSYICHLWGAHCWIGGIRGSDTLVSGTSGTVATLECGEFQTTPIDGVIMEKIQAGVPLSGSDQQAVSHQDIIIRFTDTAITCPNVVDYLRGTSHIPLNVEVTQKTYTWSHDIADDFILFDITIKNIGRELIKEMYIGIETRPSVMVDLEGTQDDGSTFIADGIVGFVDETPSRHGCGIVDTLNMMWAANFNGMPYGEEFIDDPFWIEYWMWFKSATSAHGVFFLDYPEQGESRPVKLSYNWYCRGLSLTPDVSFLDFGPRHREGFRDFLTGGGTGIPRGDANSYHVLSNGEIDYDVLRTASIGSFDPIWVPPPPDFANQLSTKGVLAATNMLSVGPFDVPAGASIKIPYVFVCGENFHTDPNNRWNLPHDVDLFYDNLDFFDLLKNASWARWVYDNPGVDTDGDDYAGEFTVCDGDTIYTTGDGIPDWRCAEPPPPPKVWLEPTVNGIRVRFNGTVSETERDIFSGVADFEGYRIYCGLDGRATSLSVMASYDRNDYNKFVLTYDGIKSEYYLFDIPFSVDSLRCLYGSGPDPCIDSVFDPANYTRTLPYIHPDFPDSIFYFQPVDYNISTLGGENSIARVYPDEPDPSIYHPDSIPDEAYTSDGLLKYYEYEFEITNLLATIPYWISVTAFDYGYPQMDIEGLESSRTAWIQSVYPMSASDAVAGGNTRVYVYPNPYRGDADYRDLGFEGRMREDRPDHRVRAIHFANLPPKCRIYIYSLDGDLVRQLDHDVDPSDPSYNHHVWNMITRNTQMVVTGLYYWVVETEDGTTQMGKLVIIF
ncbi:MAG: hypothetical protein JSV52_02145 [Candidatus Zixiibacteriota bacterium]|nr:MAG: hypothetical protein JSV52_02145 [candidate division Zixibacteria bacterium]